MEPAPFAQRRVGTTLRGKWTLERLLGEGGMAAVYVGVHRIGQRAAIKILHPEIARSRELCARFEQEAHAVNRFTHPGVVAVRDVDVTEDGAPFLVMELLEGESLADLASRPAGVEAAEVIRLVDALLDVLVAAHAQGIVHRDIKPDNLFVTRDGRLKVLDFGIARVKDGMKDLHTRAGAMLGTAPYMSPEQIRGVDIDARVDLFAVGATMFRLLARRRIHEASSEPELLVKMATMPAPPLLSVSPSVSPELARIVDRALAFDRDARYPDAASMQRDIRALLAAGASAASEVAPAAGVDSSEPTRREGPVPVLPVEPGPRVVVPVAAGVGQVVSAVSVADPTLLVSAPVVALPAAMDQQRRDETKTAVILLLGLALLAVLALVVVLVARTAVATDTTAPASSTTAAVDDPDPPQHPSEGVTPPPRPTFQPWDHRGKGKGKGHGKKHHEDD